MSHQNIADKSLLLFLFDLLPSHHESRGRPRPHHLLVLQKTAPTAATGLEYGGIPKVRMRILIAGRSGSGKSSLINAIFKETLAEVYHRESGPTDINKEYTSENDKRVIIHDSQGYDPGTTEIYDTLEKFITQRNASTGTERLDAIWLCIPVPFAGGSIYNTWDEKVVQFNGGKVPIIVVFTKLDLLIARAKMTRSSLGQGEIIQESVEQSFREKQGPEFEQLSKSEERKISYTVVGSTLPDTVQRLVDFTIQTVESYEAPESVEY